jgi:hypothetical protein
MKETEVVSLKRILNINIVKNIYLCLTGAGVVVFMFYCMQIGFFPTGVSLTDVIFFLMAIISFSLFLVFFLVCWYSMAVVASNLFMKITLLIFKKKLKKRDGPLFSLRRTNRMARFMKIYEPVSGHILMSIIGGFVIFLTIKSGKGNPTLIFSSVILTAFWITSIPNIYLEKNIKREQRRKYMLIMFAIAPILFFISGMPPLLSDAGMSLIGVRKSNVTVILDGNDLKMARLLTGNQNQTYFLGDALFTGVGTTSLLLINHRRMIVSNSNLSLSF